MMKNEGYIMFDAFLDWVFAEGQWNDVAVVLGIVTFVMVLVIFLTTKDE